MKPAARRSVKSTLLILAAILLPADGMAGAAPDAITPSAAAPRVMLNAGADNEAIGGFIVYYRDDAAPGDEAAKAAADTRKAVDQDLARVNAALSVSAKRERRLATGGHLLSLSKALGQSAATRFMH